MNMYKNQRLNKEGLHNKNQYYLTMKEKMEKLKNYLHLVS